MQIDNTAHEILAQNMKRYREAKGWKKSDLARHSGIDASHISNIENGKKRIGLELMEKIALALGIEPFEMIRPYDVGHIGLGEKLSMIEELHPMKKQAIEQMINAFLKEKELEG